MAKKLYFFSEFFWCVAINEGRINELLAKPTEFVYGDYYHYGGTLSSRPLGSYWSATVHSATNSRYLVFNTNGTTRTLAPQSYYLKGSAFAVRCVVGRLAIF